MGDSPWSNQVQQTVIVSGSALHGGVFVYNGIPGPGNTPIASITNATTDPFGNGVVPGITSQQAGRTASLFGAELLFGLGSFISESASGILTLGGTAGTNAINALLPFNPTLTAIQPGTTATAETWHNITPDAGWTVVSSFRYKLLAENNAVWLYGDVSHAAFTVATNMSGTNPLPAAYRPAGTVSVASPLYPSGRCGVEITTGGVIVAEPLGVSCTQVNINGIYPLD